MQITYLREFIELMNCMSFNKAAEKLYISQPALSNHIAELEREFGTTLVSRDRPIKPTVAGMSLYGDARKIIEIYDGARRRCREFEKAGTKGSLTVKIPHGGSDGRKAFLALVSAFRTEHPFIDVQLVSGNHKYLLDELRSGGIDCGTMPLILDVEEFVARNADLDFIPSSSEPLGVWMDPSNPLAKRTSLTVDLLDRCHYPLPSGAQFKELEASAVSFFELSGVVPQYRYVLTETFDEFLFGMLPNEVLLGLPSGTRGVSGALDEKVFVPLEPPMVNRSFIVMRANDPDPALALFREHVLRAIECGEI